MENSEEQIIARSGAHQSKFLLIDGESYPISFLSTKITGEILYYDEKGHLIKELSSRELDNYSKLYEKVYPRNNV